MGSVFTAMQGPVLTVLVCLIVGASSGFKLKKKKEGEKCGLQYSTGVELQYRPQCRTTYSTECTVSGYSTQCSNVTVITYNTECSVETIKQPVQQCSTVYVTQCYNDRKKRGIKKLIKNLLEKKKKENPSPTRECRKVPQQSCQVTSYELKEVETCHKVPMESQEEECKEVAEKSCEKVPNKTCEQVVVK